LQSIFDVFIKTRDKISSEPQPVSSQSSGPSANDKVEAEKFKQAGNAQMSSKEYDAAIESYNKAVSLDSTNPVITRIVLRLTPAKVTILRLQGTLRKLSL